MEEMALCSTYEGVLGLDVFACLTLIRSVRPPGTWRLYADKEVADVLGLTLTVSHVGIQIFFELVECLSGLSGVGDVSGIVPPVVFMCWILFLVIWQACLICC